MKERGILFSGPMIRALLDGRKTQTRRVVKMKTGDARFVLPRDGRWQVVNGEAMASHDREWLACPYGIPGDRLWVRETFMGPHHIGDGDRGCIGFGVLYRADDKFIPDDFGCACDGPCGGVLIAHPWKPSIFMPRSLSRLTLELTDVRVERVQAISHADCEAEGIERGKNLDNTLSSGTVKSVYAQLWDSINATRGYGWDVNPWVWALTFKMMTP